jgi:hypothetical protein
MESRFDQMLVQEISKIELRESTSDASDRLWKSLELVSQDLTHDRLTMGRVGLELRNLYSERSNSAGRRRSSGHGSFEAELRKRGYKPNRIREAIRDYRVSIGELPQSESTKAKRAARSMPSADFKHGWQAAREYFLDTEAQPNDEYALFARTMNHAEAKAVFRAMAKRLHPDHGGSAERMATLNNLWERLEPHYLATTRTKPVPTLDLDNSTEATIQ